MLSAVACAATCLAVPGTTAAAELTVDASAGPLPNVMGALIPLFERASGHRRPFRRPERHLPVSSSCTVGFSRKVAQEAFAFRRGRVNSAEDDGLASESRSRGFIQG